MLLYEDIVLKICNILSDRDKIHLTALSKQFDKLKIKIRYRTKINTQIVKDLPYFDNFENVVIEHNLDKYPKYAKTIEFITNDTKSIPNFVTHPTLTDEHIEHIIPSSVTHLTFFWCTVSEKIGTKIPLSVTNLIFKHGVWTRALYSMPSSVTHLTFHYMPYLDEHSISPHITHLTVYSEKKWGIRLIIHKYELSEYIFSGSIKKLIIFYYEYHSKSFEGYEEEKVTYSFCDKTKTYVLDEKMDNSFDN